MEEGNISAMETTLPPSTPLSLKPGIKHQQCKYRVEYIVEIKFELEKVPSVVLKVRADEGCVAIDL